MKAKRKRTIGRLFCVLRYWWNPSTYNAGEVLHRVRFNMSVEDRRFFYHFTFRETPVEAHFRLQKEANDV